MSEHNCVLCTHGNKGGGQCTKTRDEYEIKDCIQGNGNDKHGCHWALPLNGEEGYS